MWRDFVRGRLYSSAGSPRFLTPHYIVEVVVDCVVLPVPLVLVFLRFRRFFVVVDDDVDDVSV